MVKRRFLLGEDWLYYKIYCGVRTADTILEELIAPLSQKLLEEQLISSWFFIRYGDPDPHLRLRFKILNKRDLGIIIDEFNTLATPYLDENLIWNVQTDTYSRELERYGSNTMKIAEDIFFYDSEFVLDTLSRIKDEELYFFYTLKSIDMFVDQFSFSPIEKLEFYKSNAQAYKTEFQVGKPIKLGLDKKYRTSNTLFHAIMNEVTLNDSHKPMLDAVRRKKEQMAPFIKALLKHETQNTLEVNLNELLVSYVHMTVNRTFRDQQRFYEMVGYDFLLRYQNSKLKRRKKILK